MNKFAKYAAIVTGVAVIGGSALKAQVKADTTAANKVASPFQTTKVMSEDIAAKQDSSYQKALEALQSAKSDSSVTKTLDGKMIKVEVSSDKAVSTPVQPAAAGASVAPLSLGAELGGLQVSDNFGTVNNTMIVIPAQIPVDENTTVGAVNKTLVQEPNQKLLTAVNEKPGRLYDQLGAWLKHVFLKTPKGEIEATLGGYVAGSQNSNKATYGGYGKFVGGMKGLDVVLEGGLESNNATLLNDFKAGFEYSTSFDNLAPYVLPIAGNATLGLNYVISEQTTRESFGVYNHYTGGLTPVQVVGRLNVKLGGDAKLVFEGKADNMRQNATLGVDLGDLFIYVNGLNGKDASYNTSYNGGSFGVQYRP